VIECRELGAGVSIFVEHFGAHTTCSHASDDERTEPRSTPAICERQGYSRVIPVATRLDAAPLTTISTVDDASNSTIRCRPSRRPNEITARAPRAKRGRRAAKRRAHEAEGRVLPGGRGNFVSGASLAELFKTGEGTPIDSACRGGPCLATCSMRNCGNYTARRRTPRRSTKHMESRRPIHCSS
jgi:hypothetical protein